MIDDGGEVTTQEFRPPQRCGVDVPGSAAQAAAPEGTSDVLLASFRERRQEGFLSALDASSRTDGFVSARQALGDAGAAAGEEFYSFALECLLTHAQQKNPQPQVGNLLAGLGPGTAIKEPSQRCLGAEGEAVVERLVSSQGHLKLVVKVLEAWGATGPGRCGETLCRALTAEVLRETRSGAPLVAATALGAMPHLLGLEDTQEVLEAVDNGNRDRDDAAEKLAANLCRDAQVFFVKRRRGQKRLKATAKAVEVLGLQQEYPEADFEWRQDALASAIEKGRREAAVGLSFSDPRLHAPCVRGLVQMGEAALCLELARAWAVELSPDERARATEDFAAYHRNSLYVELPAKFPLAVVDTEAAVSGMRTTLLDAEVIGLDMESLLDGKPVLLQLATLDAAFLIDLRALGASQQLAAALQEVFCAPKVVKVGFAGTRDLAAIGKIYPALRSGCERVTPIADVGDLEVQRRIQENARNGAKQLSKKVASQGVSLSALAEQYFGRPLDKSLQISDWGARPLSVAQMHYAAIDAWVPIRLYSQLRSLL